uniref:Uncharacterized protein n=1 Tax=Zooxanthella nutricula TaxID=1333877 RepID=A0A7S2NKB2_9DINO
MEGPTVDDIPLAPGVANAFSEYDPSEYIEDPGDAVAKQPSWFPKTGRGEQRGAVVESAMEPEDHLVGQPLDRAGPPPPRARSGPGLRGLFGQEGKTCPKVPNSKTYWKTLPRSGNAGWYPPQALIEPWGFQGVGLFKAKYKGFINHWWVHMGVPCAPKRAVQGPVSSSKSGAKCVNILEDSKLNGCDLADELAGRFDHQPMKGTQAHYPDVPNRLIDINRIAYGFEWFEAKGGVGWPFPSYCARASVALLSTVYQKEYRQATLSAGIKVLFTSFKYSEKKCKGVSKRKFERALDKTRTSRKACWNFVYDWTIVMCYLFRGCQCTGDDCTPENALCCKARYEAHTNGSLR